MNLSNLRAGAVAAVLLAMTLSGCATQDDESRASSPSTESSASTPSPVPAGAEALLAEYGLDGLDTAQVIDRLDRLAGPERPTDLMASVRPDELVVSAGTREFSLEIPDDRFYLSVAPYVDQTHDCFHHSLTTCTGELSSTEVQVQIVDRTHDEVVLDETRTTFENGFTGFWLPRDIEGTLRVTYDGKTGETDFATGQDDATCLTTLRLT